MRHLLVAVLVAALGASVASGSAVAGRNARLQQELLTTRFSKSELASVNGVAGATRIPASARAGLERDIRSVGNRFPIQGGAVLRTGAGTVLVLLVPTQVDAMRTVLDSVNRHPHGWKPLTHQLGLAKTTDVSLYFNDVGHDGYVSEGTAVVYVTGTNSEAATEVLLRFGLAHLRDAEASLSSGALRPHGHAKRSSLYRALITTRIGPAEVPAGSTLLGFGAMNTIDLRLLVERMSAQLGYAARSVVIIRTSSGHVLMVLLANAGDSQALLGHVLLAASRPATYVGDLVGASRASNSAYVFLGGEGIANIGRVFLLALATDGDPGTAGGLLALAAKHLRDAERALTG